MDLSSTLGALTAAWDMVKAMLPNPNDKRIREMDARLAELRRDVDDLRDENETIKAVIVQLCSTVGALVEEARRRDPDFRLPADVVSTFGLTEPRSLPTPSKGDRAKMSGLSRQQQRGCGMIAAAFCIILTIVVAGAAFSADISENAAIVLTGIAGIGSAVVLVALIKSL